MKRYGAGLVTVVMLSGFLAGCSSTPEYDVYKTAALQMACNPTTADGFGDFVFYFKFFNGIGRMSGTDTNSLLIRATYDCLGKAQDCNALDACKYVSADVRAQVCKAGKSSACYNGSIVDCGDPKEYLQRCSDAGLKCIEWDTGAMCAVKECSDKKQASCSGNDLQYCDPGNTDQGRGIVVSDCNASGSVCAPLAAEGSGCVGKGQECSSGVDQCDGQYVVQCKNGKESRFDCKKIDPGLTCSTDSSLGCVPAKSDCTGVKETCDLKGVIGYCDMGTPATYDCKKNGFSGCALNGRGTGAYCLK